MPEEYPTPSEDEYFTFTLLDDDTYSIKAKHYNMPAEVILPSTYNGKAATQIDSYAFSERRSLTEIVIPNSITSIDYGAFNSCSSLTEIVIPNNVTSISSSAFFKCSSLTTVYYGGKEDDWNKIDIDDHTTCLTNATKYFYSETEPVLNEDGTAYDGNYWHYVEGVATPWVKED